MSASEPLRGCTAPVPAMSASEPLRVCPMSWAFRGEFIKRMDVSIADVLVEVGGCDGPEGWRFMLALSEFLSPALFSPGEALTVRGAAAERLIFLRRGEAAVYVGDAKAATWKDSSLIGEMALFGNGTHRATVCAVTPCDCRVVPIETFRRVLQDFPGVRQKFLDLARARANQASVRERLPAAVARTPGATSRRTEDDFVEHAAFEGDVRNQMPYQSEVHEASACPGNGLRPQIGDEVVVVQGRGKVNRYVGRTGKIVADARDGQPYQIEAQDRRGRARLPAWFHEDEVRLVAAASRPVLSPGRAPSWIPPPMPSGDSLPQSGRRLITTPEPQGCSLQSLGAREPGAPRALPPEELPSRVTQRGSSRAAGVRGRRRSATEPRGTAEPEDPVMQLPIEPRARSRLRSLAPLGSEGHAYRLHAYRVATSSATSSTPDLDGLWTKQCEQSGDSDCHEIRSGVIHWASGSVTQMRRTQLGFATSSEDGTFTASLVSDASLLWSNGSVWRRHCLATERLVEAERPGRSPQDRTPETSGSTPVAQGRSASTEAWEGVEHEPLGVTTRPLRPKAQTVSFSIPAGRPSEAKMRAATCHFAESTESGLGLVAQLPLAPGRRRSTGRGWTCKPKASVDQEEVMNRPGGQPPQRSRRRSWADQGGLPMMSVAC